MGLGALGLATLTGDPTEARTSKRSRSAMAPKPSHFPGSAKHVIHIFCNGGPSHVDTFDPKPALTKYAGKALPMENLRTERKTGAALPSPFQFRKYGESGIEVSDLFPHVGQSIDDVAVIRSMHADVPNHEPSLMLMNCGDGRLVRPSVGSWVTYGLGTENQNLPGFIAMCPGGLPITETANWRSAFLPGVYQGTHIDTKQTEVEKLIAHIRNDELTRLEQRRQLDLLQALNQRHLRQRGEDAQLESRIQSFELAYRMQMEAAEAFDVHAGTATRPRNVRPGRPRAAVVDRAAARRARRAVRTALARGGPALGQPRRSRSQPPQAGRGKSISRLGALLKDLKQRGLLEETLVVWGGEFGRTPVVELPTPGANQGKVNGRDHNHHGFSMWLAGGGVKGGQIYGADRRVRLPRR